MLLVNTRFNIIFYFGWKWPIILLLIVAITLVLAWTASVHRGTSIISLVNMYRHEVIVEALGQSIKLTPFEVQNLQTGMPGDVTVTVKDKSGNVLDSRSHRIALKGELFINYLSEDNYIKQCLVKANVTGLYYPAKDTVSEVQVLSVQESAVLQSNVSRYLNTVVYPGTFDGQHLIHSLPTTQEITGYFPIHCEDVSDTSAIQEKILWWYKYDHVQQQGLLSRALRDIQNSPEYNVNI